MKFIYPNAFSINRLVGMSFPFSYEIEKDSEVFEFYIYPTQLISIADILEKYAQEFLVVFDIGHYFFGEANKTFDLAKEIQSQAVELIEFDKQTLGFKSKDLCKLLTDFNHYNFVFFDFLTQPTFEDVYDNYLICKSHDWKSDEKLLPKLTNSNLYVSSHDDCYLHIETKNINLLREIFERTLQYFVLTKDFQNRLSDKELEEIDEVQEVEISSLPKDFIKEVFAKNKPLTIFQDDVTIEEKTIKIPFSLTKFDFQKPQE